MSSYPEMITSKAAREAAEACANLNLLGALIALCEHSLGRDQRMHRLESKIVAMCRMEAQAQLRIMDEAHGRRDSAPITGAARGR